MIGSPTRRRAATVVSALLVFGPPSAAGSPALGPYHDAGARPLEYTGPGREEPQPKGLTEVRFAYFGPDDPGHPTGGDPWLAAGLAVEEVNHAGGVRGLPLRLEPAWSENPWGTGIGRLARLAFEQDIWAVVGSIDGASTHLAEQIVAKARLPLIGPAGTDGTVNLANVPWAFSLLPSDDRQAELVGRALLDRIGARPFTVVSATDHDSRATIAEFEKYLRSRGTGPAHHFRYPPDPTAIDELARRVAATEPAAVLLVADATNGAEMLVALREACGDVPVFGAAPMGSRAFLQRAGAAAEGVVFPLSCDASALSGSFAHRFAERFGVRPDCPTIQTYDAIRLLASATERAGLNRALIRDAVVELSPWSGVAGPVDWGPLGQNRRAVRLATIRNGLISPR